MDITGALARAASSTGHVTVGGFLASVHREVSVALCKGCSVQDHAIFTWRVNVHSS
jgi:hypothetical protein